MEPKYEFWALQGIFDAANNSQVLPTPKSYTWGPHDPSTRGQGQAQNNPATPEIKDHYKSDGTTQLAKGTHYNEDSINTHSLKTSLANQLTGDVQKIHNVWDITKDHDAPWTDADMKPPVITSTVVRVYHSPVHFFGFSSYGTRNLLTHLYSLV